jgi:hypothetical protein
MHKNESNSHSRIRICICTISFRARGDPTVTPHWTRVGDLMRAVATVSRGSPFVLVATDVSWLHTSTSLQCAVRSSQHPSSSSFLRPLPVLAPQPFVLPSLQSQSPCSPIHRSSVPQSSVSLSSVPPPAPSAPVFPPLVQRCHSARTHIAPCLLVHLVVQITHPQHKCSARLHPTSSYINAR